MTMKKPKLVNITYWWNNDEENVDTITCLESDVEAVKAILISYNMEILACDDVIVQSVNDVKEMFAEWYDED